MLALVAITAAVPASVAPHAPFGPPFFDPLVPPSAQHPMGTDLLGRDVSSRVAHGARIAVASALASLTIALVLGRGVAVLARQARLGRRQLLIRAVDLVLVVPSAATALLLAFVLGPGVTEGVVAVGVSLAPALASVWLPHADRTFSGPDREASASSLVLAAAISVQAFGTATLSLTAIDFIGLGWAAPAPAWGVLLGQGHGALADAWWLTVFPGSLVLAVVLASMVVGDALLQLDRGRGASSPERR